MSALAAPPPEQGSPRAAGKAAHPSLLIDQFLPTYDIAVVRAEVFRAPPSRCYEATTELDLFQAPLIRVLMGIRAPPQRLADVVLRHRTTPAREASHRTFRLRDMSEVGWISLGETPGVEMVLGQVSRPWKGIATPAHAPTTPEQFTSFDEPGFAKIATGLRFNPYGDGSSILTLETRVAVTDDTSRRRFRRYWLIIGPFSSLIRRMAFRLLEAELRRSTPSTSDPA